MKAARVAVLSGLLLTMAGSAGTPLLDAPPARVLYPALPPGVVPAFRFWYARTGHERTALSSPADARLSAAYARTQARARKLGFVFDAPRLRVTKPELALLLGPGIKYIYAMHYPGPRTILVNGWWTDQMDSHDLELLLAHELSHAIDVQYERRGHHLLDAFPANIDDDVLADILAMLMYDPGEYRGFLARYPSG